jgi:putative CocE/NonD family hydrolase
MKMKITMKITMKMLKMTVLLLALFGAGPAAVRALEPEQPPVDLLWGVKIPLRDGVVLNATVYKPGGQKAPLPVAFTFTPYTADSYHERALYFARHGFVFALVDVRGRGNSGGRFDPLASEGRDGYDVVEWLARQPWSNGKITMWGGSYAGMDQWQTVRETPPHLATAVPVASVGPGIDFPMTRNIFSSYDIQWLTYTSGLTANRNLFGESSFWLQKYRELYLAHRPFRELDQVVGNNSTVFQTWLAHPTMDAFWKAMWATPEQLAAIRIPLLTITGHYDADQGGALTWYRSHMRHGNAEAREKHYLIIGPWDHAGTRTPRAEVDGVTFGAASLVDMNKLHADWYGWTMSGGPKPEFLKQRVAYYVPGPGAETWKYADSLEGVEAERRTLYLGSDGGRMDDVFHSGRLSASAPPAQALADRWTYDPLDTRPAEREPTGDSNTSQRAALNLFGAGAVYHSEPFPEALDVAGQVKLSLWISLDVPDTDLQATLYEILPDGGSILLTADYLRARYRESLETEKLVEPGKVERYDFTHFTWFARRISQGSRLRLVVSSPNSIYLEKNYNSGGVVAAESGKDARTAHVTLVHDAAHPSALEIPIGK